MSWFQLISSTIATSSLSPMIFLTVSSLKGLFQANPPTNFHFIYRLLPQTNFQHRIEPWHFQGNKKGASNPLYMTVHSSTGSCDTCNVTAYSLRLSFILYQRLPFERYFSTRLAKYQARNICSFWHALEVLAKRSGIAFRSALLSPILHIIVAPPPVRDDSGTRWVEPPFSIRCFNDGE